MNVHRVLLLAASTVALTGCSEGTGPGSDDLAASLRTDLTSYDATYVGGEGAYQRYGFELIATFSNQGTGTLYLLRCAPDSKVPLFQLRGIGIESGFNRAFACLGHDKHLAVEPGATRVDTLSINGPTEWSGDSHVGSLEGDFELHYFVAPCPSACGDEAVGGWGVSNRFRVQVRGREGSWDAG